MGVRVNASKHEDLFLRLNRLNSQQKFTDLDFAAYSAQRNQIRKLFKEFGYEINENALLMHGNSRMLFHEPVKGYSVDVFFDRLHYSHDVLFGQKPESGRLHIAPLTLSAADLVLEKLQIHEINEKDIKDLIVLFVANKVGKTGGENMIDGGYIAATLADDWEFWYEATINLDKVRKFLNHYGREGLIDTGDQQIVSTRLDDLRKFIDEQPKTHKWEKRRKNGSGKKWWRDVEERSR
jgi:hypothetical protein